MRRVLIAVGCVVLLSSCNGQTSSMINARVESIEPGSPTRACLRNYDNELPDRGCYRFAEDDADLLKPGNCLWVKVPSDADPDPEFADQPLRDISMADESRCP
jgi:hypothetical protein